MATFDFDSLTLGEVATIEELSGTPIGSLGSDTPQGKFLAALYMVGKRRSGEPTFTFNKALGTSVHEAQEFLGFTGDDADEADEADEDSPEGKAEPLAAAATSEPRS